MTNTIWQASPDSQLYWVADNVIRYEFPDVERALRDPNGLLAIGGDLSPRRLLDAYSAGIFPWFSKGQPILWWSPNPRCVLEPGGLRISRSLRKTLRSARFRVTCNQAYADVVQQCSLPRRDTADTWITPEVRRAFVDMYELGHGLSMECWQEGRLVGGLYGLVIGRIFFGESMFSHAADASKVAMVHLAHELGSRGYRLIDCQIHSAHLQSLGARPMPRRMFVSVLRNYCPRSAATDWPRESTLP